MAKQNSNTKVPQRGNLGEFFLTWARIGFLSFGGPAAQIALMHRVIVDEKRWLPEKGFLDALGFCMLLPGPEAMQLATFTGWRLRGVLGGLIAGLLFVLPGALVILLLASAYAVYGQVPMVNAMFSGIKAAVVIIVIEALIKLSKRALVSWEYWLLAMVAFVAIYFLQVPFPLIVAASGTVGWFIFRNKNSAGSQPALPDGMALSSLKTALIWLSIWWLPIMALHAGSTDPILADLSLFFSKLAVVTFGGAYAVLAYMTQDVVNLHGWLTTQEMVDGLGLAETTPGPLILVTEFVGFLSAHQAGGFWLGLQGAAITLWVTFTPCFLWIFVGAPYIDWISHHSSISGALAAITAAIVGVILNLSLWFALHVLFGSVQFTSMGPLHFAAPDFGSLDWRAVLLMILSAMMLLILRLNMITVLLTVAICGVFAGLIA